MEERLQRTRTLFSVSLRKPGDLVCSGHSRNELKIYFGSQTCRGFADGFNVWDIKWGGIKDDSQVSVLNEWVESSQNRLSRLLSTRPQLELGMVVHHSHLWQMALCDHANELRYLPTPTLSYSWPFPNQLWDSSAPPTCLLVLEPQMWFGIILSVFEWWSLGAWGCGWGSFPLSSLPLYKATLWLFSHRTQELSDSDFFGGIWESWTICTKWPVFYMIPFELASFFCPMLL